MFFLLRMAFWLTLVLALLPTGSSQPAKGPPLHASDAVTAATAAVSDMSNFCTRQAEACEVGTQAAGIKNRDGAWRRPARFISCPDCNDPFRMP